MRLDLKRSRHPSFDGDCALEPWHTRRFETTITLGTPFGLMDSRRYRVRYALCSRSRRPAKEPGVACPAPGGEPLRSVAALGVGSRRLPGTSRSAAVLWAVVSPHGTEAMGKTLR